MAVGEVDTATAVRRLRADAQRNEERLLSEARQIFARHGDGASLEEIARAAGVGIGTLYRHFPTRQALIEAVYLRDVQTLRDQGDQLLGADSPLDALATWLRANLAVGKLGRSLAACVMTAKLAEGTPINTCCTQMRATGQALLDRAKASGMVRPDVDLSDVLRMVHGIVLVNEQLADPDGPSLRMLDLVVAGIRA